MSQENVEIVRRFFERSTAVTSSLLGQADRFEDLLPLRKNLEADSFAVSHRPKVSDPVLNCGATASRSGAHEKEHRNLIAALEKLLWLSCHLLERLEQILKESPYLLCAVVCPRVGDAIGSLEFQVRVRVTHECIPVTATEGLVTGAKCLDVVPRHARSIPQATGASEIYEVGHAASRACWKPWPSY